MSYDSLKAAAGRERIDVLQITRERCTRTNGVAPCTATSTCVNSWATCRSRANYNPEDFTVSFCTPASVIPSGMIPFLQSVRSDSAEPDPENGWANAPASPSPCWTPRMTTSGSTLRCDTGL